MTVFARTVVPFPNARTAFKSFMQAMGLSSKDRVLLPAYVGWSRKEGSGVFDPIQEVGVDFTFYRITRDLTIDLDDLRSKLMAGHISLLVVIHYFGYPDPGLGEAVASARRMGVPVIEDEAHALYSDWIGGVCGRIGHASFFSLHKMLPFASGGLLVLNGVQDEGLVARAQSSELRRPLEQDPLCYDLFGISRARRQNTFALLDAIRHLEPEVAPLRPSLPEGVVPQTLPVLVQHHSRDELYDKLNDAGFGVVSLYHTMISQISASDFPDSHWLSRRILNLPVHQDITPAQLLPMVDYLAQLVGLGR